MYVQVGDFRATVRDPLSTYTVTESADFGFIPDNSTTLTPPGSPGVSREAKLSTEFEFGSLVR